MLKVCLIAKLLANEQMVSQSETPFLDTLIYLKPMVKTLILRLKNHHTFA